MSFDPPPSLVRICSEGIIGKDAHVNVFRVVYGHEKWETVSMCYFYNNNNNKNKLTKCMESYLWHGGRENIIGLFCTQRPFTSCLVLNHAKYFEVYLCIILIFSASPLPEYR